MVKFGKRISRDKKKKVKIKELPAKQSMFTKTAVTLLATILILGALDIWCYCSLLVESRWMLTLFSIGTGLLMGLGIVFFITKRIGWLKAVFTATIIAALLTWAYYLIEYFDILKYITDREELQGLLESAGIWKYILYVLIQFLQVTIIPFIPSTVTTITGTFLFGPLAASLLSLVGIWAGSLFAFWLGNKFGEKLVSWIVGKKQMEKYSSLIFDKGKYLFFLMMLFPIFPDDILCLIAGMTTMTYRFFIITNLITRPIGIFLTCYFASGEIIPYYGWGLVVWAILIIAMIILFWLSYRYKDKIEEWVEKLGQKLSYIFMNKTDKLYYRLGIKKEQKLLPEQTLTAQILEQQQKAKEKVKQSKKRPSKVRTKRNKTDKAKK